MKGKKGGGRTGMKISGNPNVFAEAAKKSGTRKTGGRVARKTGGVVKAKADLGFMTGGAVRPRLDRPGRKTGGAVGANKSPLSTAHKAYASGGGVGSDKSPLASSNPGSKSGGGSPNPKDSYGGTPAD